MRISKAYQYTENDFIELINTSKTIYEVSQKMGYSKKGRHAYDLIRQRCKELNLDISHLGQRCGNSQKTIVQNLDDVLIKNSPYKNMNSLKRRLINEGKLEYKCAICNNKGFWNNQPLVLQLDHINGEHTDNRLENLRLLCPNCHSQTDTFCTRQFRAKAN